MTEHIPQVWLDEIAKGTEFGKRAAIAIRQIPKQRTQPKNRSQTQRSRKGKPGTELEKILSWIVTIKPETSTCSCHSLRDEMDIRGLRWCRENCDSYLIPKLLENRKALSEEMRKTGGLSAAIAIIGDLSPEAILRSTARKLISLACSNAEQKVKKVKMSPKAEQRRNRHISNSPPINYIIPPLTDTPNLTLLFHIWPHGDAWKYHIDKLKPILPRFNRLLLGIATDEDTASPEEVIKAFDPRWETVLIKNEAPEKTGLREVATYQKMIPMLSNGVNEVTFCAHGKGVQKHTENNPAVKWWIDAMYDTVIYNIDGVIEKMNQGAGVVGSFRMLKKNLGTKFKYHFSGTYYAFRNHYAFLNGFPSFQQRWYGTESWPGDHFPLDKSACIFGDDIGNMYNEPEQPRAAFNEWRKNR